LEVYFATKALEKRLGSEKARVRAFGSDTARRIRLRIDQLVSSPTLEEMRGFGGRCHELTGDRADQLAVWVTANLRLVFEPADDPVPKRAGGDLDWDHVTAVRILEVVDYHGD
jgi:proteic killer suppression protein